MGVHHPNWQSGLLHGDHAPERLPHTCADVPSHTGKVWGCIGHGLENFSCTDLIYLGGVP